MPEQQPQLRGPFTPEMEPVRQVLFDPCEMDHFHRPYIGQMRLFSATATRQAPGAVTFVLPLCR